jgi:hypothetical protein
MEDLFDLDVKVQEVSSDGVEPQTITSWFCKLVTTASGCCPENTLVGPSCDIC